MRTLPANSRHLVDVGQYYVDVDVDVDTMCFF